MVEIDFGNIKNEVKADPVETKHVFVIGYEMKMGKDIMFCLEQEGVKVSLLNSHYIRKFLGP